MRGVLPEGPVLLFDDDYFYMGSVLAEVLRAAGREVVYVTPDDAVPVPGGRRDLPRGRVRTAWQLEPETPRRRLRLGRPKRLLCQRSNQHLRSRSSNNRRNSNRHQKRRVRLRFVLVYE